MTTAADWESVYEARIAVKMIRKMTVVAALVTTTNWTHESLVEDVIKLWS